MPFGHRHSLLGSSCVRRRIGIPHGQPTRHKHHLDPDGVVTFRMRQIRPGRVPSVPRGRWCAPARPNPSGRHLSPHNDRPLPPAETSHRARVLMTRRQRGFTRFTRPVFPSLWPPDGTAALGPSPQASHPAVTRDARRGRDGPCALDQTLRLRHQPNLLRRTSLHSCDFVSHDQVQP